MNAQTQTQTQTPQNNQILPIRFNIKTYIENEDEIKHIDYVRALLRTIKKFVEQFQTDIEKILRTYYDKDVCELTQHLPQIIRIPSIPLTPNGNVTASLYYDEDYDLDYDLIIEKRIVKIRKDNTLENGEIYVTIKGWNKICYDGWTVKRLLEEDNYQPEISIIYIPGEW